MEPPIGAEPAVEVRDYLAEERTFLAWIRTGLAVMGFGFVVAQFHLLSTDSSAGRGATGVSHWFGTVFVAVGVAVNLLSIWRHLHLVGELNRGRLAGHGASQLAVGLALFLALAGLVILLYLTMA
ncbi:MAG: hypothetical protein JWO36_3369 [Myxococcales bacterium]|nr:hypothetical protein [Myxococcales bacterium]